MNQKNNEMVGYFKEESVYKKLFPAFKKRYESLGRIGGTVSLKTYSEEELVILAEFLGMRPDILLMKRKVTLKQFENQLHKYKFEINDLKELLEEYFQQPLVSKNERLEQNTVMKQQFFQCLKRDYPFIEEWLRYIEKKPSDTYWIHRLMENSFEKFKSYVEILNRVMESLPEDPIRLPVYAQQLTGQPHALDRNKGLGKLTIHLMAVMRALSDDEAVYIPSTSEDITELLLGYNILRDDITNYVTLANILAETHNDKDKLWKIASETHSVLNVPIRELLDVKELYPSGGLKDVWIVENSGVFSSILDEVPHAPLICTHGQFNLAAWKCLEFLVQQKCTVHYASDLDPEGIGMAYRLWTRYPNNVELWKMNSESYEKAISLEETISERRLNQLLGIDRLFLADVKKIMVETESPGYQEALLEDMIRELKEKIQENNVNK